MSSIVRALRNYPRSAGANPDAPVDEKGSLVAQTPRLEVGDKAPAFSLHDADGEKVSLADYRGRKVIVYFYPAASTPGCTKEACDFRDNLGELNDAGLDVVGISPDKPEKLAKFRDAEKLTFPLLAKSRCTARPFGASSGRRSSSTRRARSRSRDITSRLHIRQLLSRRSLHRRSERP